MRRPNFDFHREALRPSFRGMVHLGALGLLPIAALLLLPRAEPGMMRLAASVYLSGLLLCFGVSAFYHRVARTARAQQVMQRLDHGAIFFLVAGTMTPVLSALAAGSLRVGLLLVVWVTSLGGALLKVLRRAWRFASSLYLVLGWLALPLLPLLWSRFGPEVPLLLLLGGVLYTVGAVLFLTGRPFREATRFGFHEVWHTLTVAAASAHFAAVYRLVG